MRTMSHAMGGKEMMAARASVVSSESKTTQVLTIMSTSVTKSTSVSERNEHKCSVSELMRAIRSPVRLPPKYSRLSFCKCEKARLRRSAATFSVTMASTAPCAQTKSQVATAAQVRFLHRIIGDVLLAPNGVELGLAVNADLGHEPADHAEEARVVVVAVLHQVEKAIRADGCP